MSKPDYDLLAHIFHVPAPKKRRRVIRRAVSLTQCYTRKDGRRFYVEKNGREWTGWFEDAVGDEYVAKTKKQLLADAGFPQRRRRPKFEF